MKTDVIVISDDGNNMEAVLDQVGAFSGRSNPVNLRNLQFHLSRNSVAS